MFHESSVARRNPHETGTFSQILAGAGAGAGVGGEVGRWMPGIDLMAHSWPVWSNWWRTTGHYVVKVTAHIRVNLNHILDRPESYNRSAVI